MIWFIVGCYAGGLVGILTMALAVAAREPEYQRGGVVEDEKIGTNVPEQPTVPKMPETSYDAKTGDDDFVDPVVVFPAELFEQDNDYVKRRIGADGDTISRQAAIDAASNECGELRGVFGRIEERLKNLPSIQQWIPVSERLPENEDIYLVALDKSNLLDNETQVTDAYWINNQWQYEVLESYEHRMPKRVIEPIEELKVIAWMPLPEPYKGEES